MSLLECGRFDRGADPPALLKRARQQPVRRSIIHCMCVERERSCSETASAKTGDRPSEKEDADRACVCVGEVVKISQREEEDRIERTTTTNQKH